MGLELRGHGIDYSVHSSDWHCIVSIARHFGWKPTVETAPAHKSATSADDSIMLVYETVTALDAKKFADALLKAVAFLSELALTSPDDSDWIDYLGAVCKDVAAVASRGRFRIV